MTLSIGLLGAGRIGAIHATSVIGHPDARLAAIAEPNIELAKIAAGNCGARLTDISGILSDPSIDAVIIATPTDTHADLVEKAAQAGKAIFCEKPVDLDIERVKSCLKVVEQAKVPLFVGFNRRFDPSFAELKMRLGSIGQLEILTITSRDPAPPPVSYIKRSGGLFRDMTIHDFDMARWLLDDEIIEVHAMGSNKVDPAIAEAGDIDTAVIVLKSRNGILCQISNSRRATYGYDQRIEAHGSLGMLRADNWRTSTVEMAGQGGYATGPLLNFFLERYAQAYRNELSAFIAALKSGAAPSPSGQDGLKALQLADAALQSLQLGRSVKL